MRRARPGRDPLGEYGLRPHLPHRLRLAWPWHFERPIMQIRVGYELIYDCPQPTPMMLMLNIHHTRAFEGRPRSWSEPWAYPFESDEHYEERREAFNQGYGIIDPTPMSIRRSPP